MTEPSGLHSISAQSLDNGTDNTKNIIAAYPYPADNETNNAAYLCIKYKDQIEGHTDWYLPSKNELDLMYEYAKENNLIGINCSGNKPNGIQCLIGKHYWSSSEYSYHYAWDQCFENSIQHYGYKKTYHSAVRAIRMF